MALLHSQKRRHMIKHLLRLVFTSSDDVAIPKWDLLSKKLHLQERICLLNTWPKWQGRQNENCSVSFSERIAINLKYSLHSQIRNKETIQTLHTNITSRLIKCGLWDHMSVMKHCNISLRHMFDTCKKTKYIKKIHWMIKIKIKKFYLTSHIRNRRCV